MEFKWFWFLIELGLILTFFRLSKGSLREYFTVFSTCYLIGMVADWIGLQFGLWVYPRVDRTVIWTGLAGPLGYAAIGSAQYFIFKYVRSRLPAVLSLVVVTNGMFLLHEGVNLLVGSWVYALPTVVVYLGWYAHVAWSIWLPRLVLCRSKVLVTEKPKTS